jgi:hypothetical protein
MHPISHPCPVEAVPSAPVEPSCPVCQGRLLPLRGSMRCARCSFTLCVGCEGADPSEYVPSGD